MDMDNSPHSATSESEADSNATENGFSQNGISAHTEPDETEHLDKIRNILYGEQSEQQTQRITRLEHRLTDSCEQLRTETHQKIDAIEARLMQRLDELSQRIEQATTGLHTTVNSVHQTLQQEIQHQTLAVKSELEVQVNTLTAQLRSQINAQQSTDSEQRVHLSKLFSEISRKLSEVQS